MSVPVRRAPGWHDRGDRREPVRWWLLAALAVFAALVAPMAAGRLYLCDDLGAFHLPVRAFYAQQLAHGEPFDWMPQLFAGFYVGGEGQAGMYHPWHRLLYGFLPLQVAMAVELAASYPLMFAGMWLWLRRLSARPEAAAAGGLIFTFSTFNLLHFLHPNAVAVVAHLPWLLWAAHLMLTTTQPLQAVAAQGLIILLTASQLLLGYPQYVWFSLLAEGGLVGYVLLVERRTGGKRRQSSRVAEPWIGNRFDASWRFVLAKATGSLAGAVQLLPTYDAWLHAARRTAGSDYAAWGSLHPANLVQLVAPYLYAHRSIDTNTHEMGAYLGAVPLVLIAWLVVRRAALGRLRRPAVGAAVLGGFGLLMALGGYGPIYRLQACLPVVGGFRFPCRYMVLFQMGASVLAGLGFALLLRDYRRARRRLVERMSNPDLSGTQASPYLRVRATPAPNHRPIPNSPQPAGEHCPPEKSLEVPCSRRLLCAGLQAAGALYRGHERLWTLAVLSLVTAMAGLALQGHPRIASPAGVLAGPLLLGAAVLLVVLSARGYRTALAGLVVLCAADLGVYGLSYLSPGLARPEQYVQAACRQSPPDEPRGRVVACLLGYDEPGLRVGNAMTMLGWQRADGYAGLEPARRLDYHRLAALRVAGVRWVRRGPSTQHIAGLVPVDRRWSLVPDPLPYARLVTRVVQSQTPGRDIGQIDLETTALCDVPLCLPPGQPGSVSLIERRPGRLAMQAQCNTRQLLVVAESWHPGWGAAVDGRPVPVLRVNGDFMGCVVEPGRHRITLSFRPKSVSLGRRLGVAGVLLGAICLWSLWRLPPSRAPTLRKIRPGVHPRRMQDL